MNNARGLYCEHCDTEIPESQFRLTCGSCGGPLEVRYDLRGVKKALADRSLQLKAGSLLKQWILFDLIRTFDKNSLSGRLKITKGELCVKEILRTISGIWPGGFSAGGGGIWGSMWGAALSTIGGATQAVLRLLRAHRYLPPSIPHLGLRLKVCLPLILEAGNPMLDRVQLPAPLVLLYIPTSVPA
jgi:hypothetical protein